MVKIGYNARAQCSFFKNDDGFRCPLNGCGYNSKDKEKVEEHVKLEKVHKVDRTKGLFVFEQIGAPIYQLCDICDMRILTQRKPRHLISTHHKRKVLICQR